VSRLLSVVRILYQYTDEMSLGCAAGKALRGAAYVFSAVFLLSGCGGGGHRSVETANLAERVGCSDSYEAVTTDGLGVEEMAKCTFRGYELSFVTFADNAARNNYVCSTCGFDVDTDTGTIEKAARRLGGRFVAGDGYLVEVPDAAAEQAVRDALG